jgi:hypothetical protein
MPEKETTERAQEDAREGKSPSTQAGEFVREEIHHVREGKHGARSPQLAIAIGLSKARRAGVKLSPPKKGKASARTRKQATRDYRKGQSGSRQRSSSLRSTQGATHSNVKAARRHRTKRCPSRLTVPHIAGVLPPGAKPPKKLREPKARLDVSKPPARRLVPADHTSQGIGHRERGVGTAFAQGELGVAPANALQRTPSSRQNRAGWNANRGGCPQVVWSRTNRCTSAVHAD